MQRLLVVIIALIGPWLLSCAPDAPRSNPLDPFHQTAVESGEKLAGRVLIKSAPFTPLPGCDVFIYPENKFAATDEQGRFQFSGLQAVDHKLAVHKSGFDSLIVDLSVDAATDDIVLNLNALPDIERVIVRSEYIDQWWPEPVLSVVVSVLADDPDGLSDLDHVSLRIAGIDSSFPFAGTAQPDSFALRLEENSVPGADLYALVGAALRVTVQDRDSAIVSDDRAKLIRIISPAPVAETPTGLAVADPSPLMQWQPFVASFRFRYLVAIYHIRAGIPTLMFTSEPLPLTQFSYQYADSLAPGTYFWTVSVVDDFGNVGRSKEASFTVP